MKMLEQSNPGVDFDWPRLLKGEAGAQPDTRPRPENRDGERRPRREGRPRDAAQPQRPPRPVQAAPPAPTPPPEPAPRAEVEVPPIVFADPPEATAAFERLGAEGVLRLRARYAELVGRIHEKITDEARQTELKTQAERLNPDTWGTPDAVAAGLEQYEAVFEGLRSVVGTRRRRRRRSGGDGGGAPEQPEETL